MTLKFRILVCLFILFSVCTFGADNVKQGTNVDIKNAQNAVVTICYTKYVESIYVNKEDTYILNARWNTCEPLVKGSGFFINKDGYFLTCYHNFNFKHLEYPPCEVADYISPNPMNLTDKVNGMFIKTNDNKRIPFKVVDFDRNKDIAICKVLEGQDYPVIPLANSQEVEEASKCYSIGTPLNNALTNTITDGIISSTDRSLSVLGDFKIREEEKRYNYSFIQHSSPIAKKNDGGPLLNEYGACIGINILNLPKHENLGIAICINHAKGILSENKVEYTKWSKEITDFKIVIEGEKGHYYYKDKTGKTININNDEIKKRSDKTKYVVIDEKEYDIPQKTIDYTKWYIIGGATLLVIICLIIFYILTNNKKKESNNTKDKALYNNNSNTQYKSKDNYDDIDIELL